MNFPSKELLVSLTSHKPSKLTVAKPTKCTFDSATDIQRDICALLAHIPEIGNIFDIWGKIGEGTFSKVYRAKFKTSDLEHFAVKYLIPTSHPSRIANELQCMQQIGGTSNVMGVKFCLMNRGHVAIIMPYFPHDKFADYVQDMKMHEIQDYMKNLLIAMDKVHSHGVIHRDIKPSNFLHHRQSKRYVLVDFGLAQHVDALDKTPSVAHDKKLLNHHPASLALENFNKRRDSAVGISSFLAFKKRPRQDDQENQHLNKRRTLQGPTRPRQILQCNLNQFNVQPENLSVGRLHGSKLACQWTNVALKSGARGQRVPLRAASKNLHSQSCTCLAKNTVCSSCLRRPQEAAPRAGTPGFRAPEVLLKYKKQTTAIDMWSAGVILLSLLSGRYPFFQASEDLTSLAEIAAIIGTNKLKDSAIKLGKHVTLSAELPAQQLKDLCARLKGTALPPPDDVTDRAYDLLEKLLDPLPSSRITAAQALLHPFISGEQVS